MIKYINTYDIATFGYNSKSTYTFSVLGYNGYLIIEDITPTPTPTPTLTPTPISIGSGGGYLSKGSSRVLRRKEREDDTKEKSSDNKEKIESKKRIKVCIIIDGVEHCKTKIVKNKPNLTADNIEVKLSDEKSDKPKIKITVKI